MTVLFVNIDILIVTANCLTKSRHMSIQAVILKTKPIITANNNIKEHDVLCCDQSINWMKVIFH